MYWVTKMNWYRNEVCIFIFNIFIEFFTVLYLFCSFLFWGGGWVWPGDLWDPSSLARDQTHTLHWKVTGLAGKGLWQLESCCCHMFHKKRGVRGINRSTEGIFKLRCRVYIGAHQTSEGVLDTNGYPKLQNNFMNSRDGREFCRYERSVSTEVRLETWDGRSTGKENIRETLMGKLHFLIYEIKEIIIIFKWKLCP